MTLSASSHPYNRIFQNGPLRTISIHCRAKKKGNWGEEGFGFQYVANCDVTFKRVYVADYHSNRTGLATCLLCYESVAD